VEVNLTIAVFIVYLPLLCVGYAPLLPLINPLSCRVLSGQVASGPAKPRRAN
jgi:hypothetical protein